MKKRVGILGILIAILVTAIGYAAITAVPLSVKGSGTVTPDQDNFKVKFVGTPEKSGSGTLTAEIDESDETKANMSVTGLKKTGETATFTYTVKNVSPENIKAELEDPSVSYTNQTYFEVKASLASPTTLAVNDTTTLTVTVKVIKTPVEDDITSDITVTVNANPKEG